MTNENTTINKSQEIEYQYEIIAHNFMKKILDLNYKDAMITEVSWLSDFNGSGLSSQDINNIADKYDNEDKNNMLYKESENLYNKIKHQYWNKLICEKIEKQYQLIINTTDLVLINIFEHIRNITDINVLKKENSKFTVEEENIELGSLDVDKLKKEINKTPKTDMTDEEIKEHLEITTSAFFYAKHADVTFSQAMDVIEERLNKRTDLYKAYRE